MKKLFLGSIALTVFSISIVIFQMSCRQDAVATPPNNCSQTATVTYTLNFPDTFHSAWAFITTDNSVNTGYRGNYRYTVSNLNSVHQTVLPFTNVNPGNYDVEINASDSVTTVLHFSTTLNIVAGQTYNITI